MNSPQHHGPGRQPRPSLPANALGMEVAWLVEHPVHDIARRLQQRGTHDQAAARRVEDLHGLLVDLVDRDGPTDGPAAFLDAPLGERRDRQAAAVTVAVLANLRVADRDGHLRQGRTLRLLSPVEVGAVRLCSTVSSLRAATVALSQAGAAPGQLPGPVPDDVRVQHGKLHVDLPASRGYRARTVTVEQWASAHVHDAAAAAREAGHRLCLTTPPGRTEADRKAATAHLQRTLAVVGADATPDAVRLTAAHDVLVAGGPPAAAAFLGTTSIDAAVRLLAGLTGPDASP